MSAISRTCAGCLILKSQLSVLTTNFRAREIHLSAVVYARHRKPRLPKGDRGVYDSPTGDFESFRTAGDNKWAQPKKTTALHQVDQQGTVAEKARYVFLDKDDPRFGPRIVQAKFPKPGKKHRTILLEGRRLILDAVKSGVIVNDLYFTKDDLLEGFLLERMPRTFFFKVKFGHMKIWSDLPAPPGIMAVCAVPTEDDVTVFSGEQRLPVTVICDQVMDPGNLGTILRTAAAANVSQVITMAGCANVWEPKVLRAGAGAHFRTHIRPKVSWNMVANYLAPDTQVCMCDNRPLSDIPEPTAHQLNVVSKFLAVGQERTFEADDSDTEGPVIDSSFDRSPEYMEHFKYTPIPSVEYTHTACSAEGPPLALLVGGEVHGLSAHAHKLTFERGGRRLHIPMSGGVESLNTGVALSIVLFELRRQMLAPAS